MEHVTREKPPIGATPRWIHDAKRLCDLASAIARYAQAPGEAKYTVIKPWAEEIVDICDNAEYGKHDR